MRHEFDLSFVIRAEEHYRSIKAHHAQVRGRARAWALQNPLDKDCTLADGVAIEDNEGAPSGTFAFCKRYGSGADAYLHRIRLPLNDGALQIWRNGSSNVTGAATIAWIGGTFTITGHTSGDVYTWSGNFDLPVRYDIDKLPSLVIDRSNSKGLLVRCDSIPVVEVKRITAS